LVYHTKETSYVQGNIEMHRIETSIEIYRYVGDVFDFVADPSNMPKWAPGYLAGEWVTKLPIRIGSKQKRVTNFGGGDRETIHVVTQFKKNSVIALSAITGPLVIEEIIETEKTSLGTSVVIAEEITAPLLLKPVEWIFAAMAKKNISAFSESLKKTLE